MILTIISFFVVLGILVLAHEAGHFYVARRAGVKVEEFGFGLPPRVFGFYRDENRKWKTVGAGKVETPATVWSLNWIPLGGFVKIKGEEGDAQQDNDSFAHKSVFARILIVSAGVAMNILLAVILLSVSLTLGSPQVIDDRQLPSMAKVSDIQIRIMEVLPGSPADKADLRVGDTIVSLDGRTFPQITALQDYINGSVDRQISVKVSRETETIEAPVTPVVLEETGKGGMGVALVQTGFVSYPWYISWWYGIIETLKMVGGVIYGFYIIIKNLIVERQMIGDVYGPVGIATLIGSAARMGFLYILQFTATLSVIIAVINFLPFPALDGGRVFFLLIEAVRRKPVNQKLETAMHNIGFALLMILVVIITFRDIARVSSGFMNWWQRISGLF